MLMLTTNRNMLWYTIWRCACSYYLLGNLSMLLCKRLGNPTVHYKGFMANIVQEKWVAFSKIYGCASPIFNEGLWKYLFFPIQTLVGLLKKCIRCFVHFKRTACKKNKGLDFGKSCQSTIVWRGSKNKIMSDWSMLLSMRQAKIGTDISYEELFASKNVGLRSDFGFNNKKHYYDSSVCFMKTMPPVLGSYFHAPPHLHTHPYTRFQRQSNVTTSSLYRSTWIIGRACHTWLRVMWLESCPKMDSEALSLLSPIKRRHAKCPLLMPCNAIALTSQWFHPQQWEKGVNGCHTYTYVMCSNLYPRLTTPLTYSYMPQPLVRIRYCPWARLPMGSKQCYW